MLPQLLFDVETVVHVAAVIDAAAIFKLSLSLMLFLSSFFAAIFA